MLTLPVPQSERQTRHLLPAYFKPLPGQMTDHDVEYLQKSGALCIPEDSLRNELLTSYIDYVHAYSPVLDVHNFLETVDRKESGAGGLSLLLFQAVLFAGTAHVDIKYLQRAGFATRRAARKTFFERPKVGLLCTVL